MSEIDYDALQYDPLVERIAHVIADELGETEDFSFFRSHTIFYFSIIANMMRTKIRMPNGREDILCYFAVNLAPTAFGKGVSTRIIENEVVNRWRDKFFQSTWPSQVDYQLEKLAQKRAIRDNIDHTAALDAVKNEFVGNGKLLFTFEKPTESALKQNRTLLQMAQMGSMNLSTDEIGANLLKSKDAIDNYLTLYDGQLQNNFVKHTRDQQRADEYFGLIPANMVLFGVPSALLDHDKVQEQFLAMLNHGYARRCFYTYVPEARRERRELTPEEQWDKMHLGNSAAFLEDVSRQLEILADSSKINQKLEFTKDAYLMLAQFDNDSKAKGRELMEDNPFPSLELRLLVNEVENRRQRVQRLAAVFAFINMSSTIDVQHIGAAIKFALDSSVAFEHMIRTDEAHIQLAKYIAFVNREVTQPHLIEHIPSFKKASVRDREAMLTQAVAWGYTNSILIKRKVSDSVEFIRGEALKPTDIKHCIISHSADIVDAYQTQTIDFDRLFTLTSTPGMNWINHELENGYQGQGYRHNDNIVPGFNLLVIDVDNGIAVQTAQRLLDGYKALYYLTKSHTPTHHRFRIVMPTNYELKLNAVDFEGLMKNLFAWLPFQSDDNTGQRSRKWLTGKADANSYFYQHGELINVLPFIPKTTRHEEFKKRAIKLGDLDSLQRWFALNTFDGIRNNYMLRYAHVLMDCGYGQEDVRQKLYQLNAQVADPIAESEIDSTIMKTVHRRLSQPIAVTP